jgi:competence protein ComEA
VKEENVMVSMFKTFLGLGLALGLAVAGWSAPAATTPTVPPAHHQQGGMTGKHPSKSAKLGTAVINLNTASEKDLQKVPGIGKARAAKIVKARPFTSVDDLVTKKIVSSKELGKMRSHLTVH